MIRFDGLYETQWSKLYDDEEKNDFRSPNYSVKSFLRFYRDGRVVTASSLGEAENVKNWLSSSHEFSSKGNYKIDGENIIFEVSTPTNRLNYSGKIINDQQLDLDLINPDTGYLGHDHYTFYEVKEWKDSE